MRKDAKIVMMKKMIALMLAGFMVFSLAACSGGDKKKKRLRRKRLRRKMLRKKRLYTFPVGD
ncbi:MAG: hypothetical protein V8S08_05330 [Lachnoclostridium sp.]